MRRFILCLITLVWMGFSGMFAQEAYRFQSEYLFRAKGPDSTFQVTKGTVFYDKNHKKLVYQNTFPKHETFVSVDTFVYQINNDTLTSVASNLIPPQHTMFHYLLSNSLSNYGMDKSGYLANGIKKENELVVTTWIPNGMMAKYFGKVLIANKKKRLYSVVIYDKDDKLISRQIFKKYVNVDGNEMPSEILSVSYTSTGKHTQIVNLNHILINDTQKEEVYNYQIPGL